MPEREGGDLRGSIRALGAGGPARRLGLRARLIVAFALGALVLSAFLSGVAYASVRETALRQRERSAVSQVYANARYVREQLRSQTDLAALLTSVQTPAASRPVLHHQGRWSSISAEFGERELPLALRRLVADGTPARMRYELNGELELAVGVPLPAVDAAYFEIVSFEELQRTLQQLSYSLLAASLATTVAGAAVGAWASRRVLRPLAELSEAAQAITGGRLDTRVEPVDDPDLDRIVESFNDMASGLQARIERDARFASDVSHELRSPLTTLAASIAVLERNREEMSERSQAALELLVADVSRFQSMVEDLLEISRFDANAANLTLERVRIAELVLRALRATTDEDFPVDIAADAADAVVMADKRRLVRVIANLIDNAAKYGGGAREVAVCLVDGHVRLLVDDAGPGVEPEDRARIFERFSRGSTAAGRRGSGEGVGLGLALVKEHIDLHGGRVWVEESPQGGARFVVELPQAVDPEPPHPDGSLDDDTFPPRPAPPGLDEVVA